MIILNSPTAVSDLFDKRASNYSDRPDMPMIVDLCVISDLLVTTFDTLLIRMGASHRDAVQEQLL